MTDLAVLGAFAFMVLCLLIVALCSLLVHLARDWAEDRERERRYAEDWQRTHQINQQMGRYGYDTHRYHYEEEGRPE